MPQVRTVECVDLHPLNRAFVAHRVAELGRYNTADDSYANIIIEK
jgi:hypothetical protein